MLPSDKGSIFRLSWLWLPATAQGHQVLTIYFQVAVKGVTGWWMQILFQILLLVFRDMLGQDLARCLGMAEAPVTDTSLRISGLYTGIPAITQQVSLTVMVQRTITQPSDKGSIFRLNSFLFLTQRDCSTIRKTVQRIMFPAAWFCGRLEYRRIKFTITLTTTGTTRCLETIFPGMLMGLVQTISLMATEHIGGLYLGRRSLPSHRIKVRFFA